MREELARMDQKLIAIIVLLGFRFVLLAIPVLDNLWIWVMRRFWHCCNGRDEPAPNSLEGGGQEIIELHPMTTDWSSPRRQPYRESEDSSGIVIISI